MKRSASSRRLFFRQVAGTASAVAGMASLAEFGGRTSLAAAEVGPLGARKRRQKAFRLRQQAALFQKNLPMPSHHTNRDDDRYANFIGSYTKGLPHDATGEVVPSAYEALRRAMSTGEAEDFALVPLGGVAKQSNPQSAFAFEVVGPDSHHLGIRVPPSFRSAEEAGEMAEAYWQALTRDVPFASYATDPLTVAAAASLSGFSDFRGPKTGGAVTPATLFRGNTPGDLVGPYLSQFLWKPVPYGPYTVTQTLKAGRAGVEYMTDYGAWLNVQNGSPVPPPAFAVEPAPRYINNNRALAAYLRADFTFQAGLHAAQILLATPNSLALSNPYRAIANQSGGITLGSQDILDLMAHSANVALKACWYQKWAVHRRVRPEAFGGSIHNMKTTAVRYPIHPEILESPVLNEVHLRYGTYLLPMAYPEGSPMHPSYPEGHGTFVGAVVTMLKALFNESMALPNPMVASADGAALVPYAAPVGEPPLTIGGELNKLAANIALGRDAAGVHWRSDGIEAMNLGEASAIGVLSDIVNCYNETFTGFTFTRFNGSTITIAPRPSEDEEEDDERR